MEMPGQRVPLALPKLECLAVLPRELGFPCTLGVSSGRPRQSQAFPYATEDDDPGVPIHDGTAMAPSGLDWIFLRDASVGCMTLPASRAIGIRRVSGRITRRVGVVGRRRSDRRSGQPIKECIHLPHWKGLVHPRVWIGGAGGQEQAHDCKRHALPRPHRG